MPKPLSEWIHLLLSDNQVPAKILFRVDAGRIWGLSFGHLSRCLTLAHAFQKCYCAKTLFLMRNYAEGIKFARNAGQKVEIIPVGLNTRQETKWIVKSIEQFKANVLVVDLPYRDIDISYFTYLRNRGTKIIFIDDCRYISPDVDVILNSSILAVENTKQVENIRYLLGPEYFIYEGIQQSRVFRKNQKRVKIVITFGGSDPAGLTMKVLTTLSKKRWIGAEFTVILGPGYSKFEQINKYAQKNMNNIRIVRNPPDISPFFLASNLAICAGGRTLYELHALRVPAFAIASIENEVPVIQAFLHQNLLVDGLEAWDEQEFTKRFDRTLALIKKREQVARNM